MGVIIRHSAAPFIDGEELPGKDLEADIVRAYNELGGNMDNANVRTGAGFVGSKLLSGSLPGDRIKSNILTSAKIEADAIISSKVKDNTLETEVMSSGALSDSAMDTDSAVGVISGAAETLIGNITLSTGSVLGQVMLVAMVGAQLSTSTLTGMRFKFYRAGPLRRSSTSSRITTWPATTSCCLSCTSTRGTTFRRP